MERVLAVGVPFLARDASGPRGNNMDTQRPTASDVVLRGDQRGLLQVGKSKGRRFYGLFANSRCPFSRKE
jgi:hypothetical protein